MLFCPFLFFFYFFVDAVVDGRRAGGRLFGSWTTPILDIRYRETTGVNVVVKKAKDETTQPSTFSSTHQSSAKEQEDSL